MPHTASLRHLAPVLLSAIAFVIPGAVSAQDRPDDVMVGTTKTTVTVTDSRGATTSLAPALMREVYVGAFRSSARQWCSAGGADALGAALRSTTLIVEQNVAGAERAATLGELTAAHAALVSAGGCAPLARAASVVVVDGFNGHRWRQTRDVVVGGDAGVRQESGLTIVTRSVKIGARRFRKLDASADYAFTTQRGELVNGRYRVPVTDESVDERWAEVEGWIAAQYPTLRVVRVRAGARSARGVRRGGARAAEGDDALRTTAGEEASTAWSTEFQNPDSHALEVRMTRRADDAGRGTIVVDYVGFAGR